MEFFPREVGEQLFVLLAAGRVDVSALVMIITNNILAGFLMIVPENLSEYLFDLSKLQILFGGYRDVWRAADYDAHHL